REAERIGVDVDLVDRLVILCWLSQVVRAVGDHAGTPADPQLARRAWAHRHRLLLEAAVEHVGG
ncbi:MAG TPA: hypothetical protein VFK93_04470, partial [Candidatus Limnocylindria bacterium]|nr:hypothetical protein [Candidatus Limnocylindria bacterium]